MALAAFAAEHRLSRPVLVHEPILRIANGRHLLAEMSTDTFIPNSCVLGEEGMSPMALLLGPNSSGKSVLMKEMGIIVFLAHVGSFIPAASGSVVGLTDKILTRISTRESLSKDQSAFVLDLLQMKRILEEATPSSLVLIDEFGKGTLNEDGVALFAACINELAAKCGPRTIAITHFHELYTLSLLRDPSLIQWLMMAVQEDSPAAAGLPCFLYECRPLAEGVQSAGLRCAKLAGLPPEIIERAKALRALFDDPRTPPEIRLANLDSQREKEDIALIRNTLFMA